MEHCSHMWTCTLCELLAGLEAKSGLDRMLPDVTFGIPGSVWPTMSCSGVDVTSMKAARVAEKGVSTA